MGRKSRRVACWAIAKISASASSTIAWALPSSRKANSVILEPVLTEKATKLAQKQVYMFKVSKDANKNQIREVLKKTYQVEVGDVRSFNRKGKTVRKGKKMRPRTLATQRIVFVKVTKGKIDVFPQV